MIPLSVRAHYVLGANTNVGKTLWSTGLAAAALRERPTLYIKPFQTGFPESSDERFVRTYAMRMGRATDAQAPSSSTLRTQVLNAWRKPASPDLAALEEGARVSDRDILTRLELAVQHLGESSGRSCVLVEGAGGVLSPSPSGSLQADLFRQYRLPVLLVGDGKLGGISTTLSSLEALQLRGLDVAAVCIFDESHSNHRTIERFVGHETAVFVVPAPPPPGPGPAIGNEGAVDVALLDWFKSSMVSFQSLHELLEQKHALLTDRLNVMQERSRSIFWWPFTQHSQAKSPMVIDSACAEHLTVAESSDAIQIANAPLLPQLHRKFDACGSWWTNGLGHGNPTISKAVAYALGRYGHVLFPNNTHALAFDLAERLLQGAGRPWASRVFFSDNGSTAIEIALKMAFRKFAVDHQIADSSMQHLQVVGLLGSYHGDTLGAMEAQAASPFTSNQHPWHSGRGIFLDPPVCHLHSDGRWHIKLPQALSEGADLRLGQSWESLQSLFSTPPSSTLLNAYESYIQAAIDLAAASGAIPAALILEPVLLGAGGMALIDPNFQRLMVTICKRLHIPVIFDEVFVGLWRVGVESAGRDLLGVHPDIACHAKLLTGGSVPLAVTLTTEPVFEAFLGDKSQALLHGHSYTAHPAGCAAALRSLEFYEKNKAQFCLTGNWDAEQIRVLAKHPKVSRVMSIGSVLAVDISDSSTAGYLSSASAGICSLLLSRGIYARPLGSTVYFMTMPTASAEDCHAVVDALLSALKEPHPAHAPSCIV